MRELRRVPRGLARLRVARTALVALALPLCTGPGAAEGDGEPPPGARLAARVEARLEQAQDRLDLSHRGLVFPVSQEELHRFMAQVRVFGKGLDDLALGTDHGLERHGGGLLALLFDHWRPEGRHAELGDRFPFPRSGARIPLGALLEAQRRQVYLPLAEADDEAPGDLPASPRLARMRLPFPGRETVEVDAWAFLRVLAEHAPDRDARWVNHAGQRLSAALLLDHARRHYLAMAAPGSEPADHGELHLVHVLLADAARGGPSAHAVQRHFLEHELARRELAPGDATLVLAHHAESLGRLLAAEGLRWSPSDRRRVRAWLRGLEDGPFRDVEAEDPRRLAHLLHGLRLVAAHLEHLEPVEARIEDETAEGRR